MQGQLEEARRCIADQAEMIQETAQQARTDALTGLANRQALNEFLQTCLEAIQPGECAGLLLLDIDHFKSFNDTYGKSTGDAVLSAFARNIKKLCNLESFAARYGDDEFAVIITGRDQSALVRKAAALRKCISEQVIHHENLQLRLPTSAGLCLLAPGDLLQAACERSEEGLSRSKKAGRNQGHWFHGSNWQQMPDDVSDAAGLRARSREARQLLRGAASEPGPAGEQAPPDRNRLAQAFAEATHDFTRAASGEATKKTLGDVLDLNTFMNRTSVYFEQLRRADLPATGMLVEAQWNVQLDGASIKTSWTSMLGLIQSQLRGIDVVCVFRAKTACIFLPGCSIEAATERASRIQMLLENSRIDWQPAEHCPDRLAISIGQALPEEETTEFLERLESALEEAQQANRFELAIHDGEQSRFITTAVQT
jgi:diguanylate cyclase (GGDEF)-like protein